jgi:FtsP/CotA-like multicopper oxidase with cupredoxin domain
MSVHELKLYGCAEVLLTPERGVRSIDKPQRRAFWSSWLSAALVAIVVIMAQALPARAQATQTPSPGASNPCPAPLTVGQRFLPVPEIISKDGKLRGTVVLSDEQEWMAFRVPQSAPSDQSRSQCLPQYVRIFRELGAIPTLASVPSGPYSKGSYAVPRPGPTLRARIGELVQLTFINQINPANFGDSIDRGETGRGGGCDESSSGYPVKIGDKFPDCFHGSSTGNIHFHGTHTNPNSTGDNVFLEVRPSLRGADGKPIVTPDSVQKSFDQFFARCEVELGPNVLKEWPKTWSDLPKTWTDEQQALLKEYDTQLEKNYGKGVKKLWRVDEAQLKQGAWPQYYIGAFPFCYRLPKYTAKVWPPPPRHDSMLMGAGTAEQTEDTRELMMGQSPGTHWYHAHKHGSTAINVANGMTGAFIIEGQYDDDLNTWYGDGWTRTQPVLVINQLGVSPNLMRGGGPGSGKIDKGPDFSVNGQLKPMIPMRPGEVQMWRIVNTSGRAGAFFSGPPPGFQWMQLAQDGVQFQDVNYQRTLNKTFLLAAGNRADLLVKAPADPCAKPEGCTYPVMVQNEVDPSDLATANKITLVSINVSGTPVAPTSNSAQFIPTAPSFPTFLTDITGAEVKGTKKIVFASTGPGQGGMHTIDGKKFDGEVGAVVLLNTVEEWKVINETYGPPISHPFHIHINPFQVVEVFDPNATLTDRDGKTVNKYVFDKRALKMPGQCYLDPNGNPDDWKPCDPTPYLVQRNLIWWDVFPIPSGAVATDANGNPFLNPATKAQIKVPGYFKMRSRFVDYSGFYVIHCHILAHEDRGMMTIVEVAPTRTPYSHH